MSEPDRRRLERDVEDALIRIRMLELAETPGLKDLFRNFRGLEQQVQHMDVEGTAIARRDLKEVRDDIAELKVGIKEKVDARIVEDMQEEQRVMRTTVRSALITAGLSICASIIVGVTLYLLLGRT